MSLIAAVTGYSTSGKTFISQILNPFEFYPLISHTTRPMRAGEMEGLDYYYTSEDVFLQMIQEDQFIEQIDFCGFKYGLSKDELERAIKENKTIIHVCTPDGVDALQKVAHDKGFDFVSAFVEANDITVAHRMLKRFTSTRDEEEKAYTVRRLIHTLTLEKQWGGEYSYILKNSDEVASIAQAILDISKNKKSVPKKIKRETDFMLFTHEEYSEKIKELMEKGAPRNNAQCWEMASDLTGQKITTEY